MPNLTPISNSSLRHIVLRGFICLVLTNLVGGWTVRSGLAAPEAAGSIGVAPNSGLAGSSATVSGTGFTGGQAAAVRFDGTTLVSFTMPGSGSFSTGITIPSGAAAGGHSITVCNNCGGGEFEESASATFTVLEPPPVSTSTPVLPTPTRPAPPTPTAIPVCTDLGLGPEAVVIDFENRGGLTAIEIEQGVRFDDSAEIIPPSVAARSGVNAAVSQLGLEFGSALRPIQVRFLEPVEAVGMFVGLDEVLSASGTLTATLTAFGYRGGGGPVLALGTDSVSFPLRPTDIRHCLVIHAAPGDLIQRVTLEYADAAGNTLGERRLMDDLTFVRSEAEYPPNQPPIVEITDPSAERVTVSGGELPVRAQIREDRGLRSTYYTVNDLDPVAIGAPPSAADPTLYTTGFNFLTGGLQAFADNTVTVFAQDSDGLTGSDSFTVRCEPPFNVQAQAIEVTQAVRGAIPSRSAPDGRLLLPPDDAVHVADRRTAVRVYPWASFEACRAEGGLTPPLTAQLFGSRNGEPLPGSPLNPANLLIRSDPVWTLEEMRADATRSWNFVLPASWVRQGTIDLRVEVNPEGPSHRAECTACGDDNIASLSEVRFQVVQEQNIEIRIYARDFYWFDGAGIIRHIAPTMQEITDTLNYWMKVWPVATWPGSDSGIMQLTRVVTRPKTDDRGIALILGITRNDADIKADNPGIAGTFNPYLFIPETLPPQSPKGCVGFAGVPGPPFILSSACGPTMAQEAAHTLGQAHAGNAHGEQAGGGFDPAYPGSHGQVEADAYGFDVWDLIAIPPTDSDPGLHDYMSYGGPTKWTSLYTWQAIAGFYGAPDIHGGLLPEGGPLVSLVTYRGSNPDQPAQSDLQPYMLISGTVSADDQAAFGPAFLTSAPAGEGEKPGEGAYRLQLIGRGDSILFERLFQPLELTHNPGGARPFFEYLPQLEGVEDIRVLHGDRVIGRLEVSRHAPEVSIFSPVAGDTWASSGTTTLAWEGRDADRGDELIYRVDASPDGIEWRILVPGTSSTEAQLDLASVPGWGENWRIRVQATDGFLVGTAEVGPIRIEPHAPLPIILQPQAQAHFRTGEQITLWGQALDGADGSLPPEALEWLLDGQSIGHGATITTAGLSIGSHIVKLVATGTEGLQGEQSVTIEVAEDADYDGLADEWELQFGLDPQNAADAAADQDGDGLSNWAELRYRTDPTQADSDGDGFPDGVEVTKRTNPLDSASAPGAFGAPPVVVDSSPEPRTRAQSRIAIVLLVTGGFLLVAVVAGVAGLAWRRARGRAKGGQ